MLPKVAFTLCSNSGIGEEVLTKSLSSPLYKKCDVTVFTNKKIKTPLKKNTLQGTDTEVIEKAIRACLKKDFDALLTLPVKKMGLGGVGHTEVLTRLTKSKTTMFFTSPKLNIALVTTHIPLNRVSSALSVEKVILAIENTHSGLKKYFGIVKPKIYLSGLNPHCGEGGLIGDSEEREILIPALKHCQKKGILVSGPFSGDTVFHKALEEKAHAVIAHYHDQGLIALKTLNFFKSCGITLGLPFLRTSVDHGTADELVGSGLAKPDSLLYALEITLKILKKYENNTRNL